MFQRMPSTSSLLGAVVIAAATAFAILPAQAASEQDRELCAEASSGSLDACTRIIEDKSESAENRAAAHAARLAEYILFGHVSAINDVHALSTEHKWSSPRILEIMHNAMSELTYAYYLEGEDVIDPTWLGEAIGVYGSSLKHLLRLMEIQNAPAAEVSIIQEEFDAAEELFALESYTMEEVEDYLDRFL